MGDTFDVVVRLQSAGDVKALRVQLGYDAAVVEPDCLVDMGGKKGCTLSTASTV